jgi:hypothetical protein
MVKQERPVHFRESYVMRTLCGRRARRGVRDTTRVQYVTCRACQRLIVRAVVPPAVTRLSWSR